MSIFYGQYTSWWWLFVPSLFVASPAQYESCDFEEGLCIWDLRSLSSLKWVRTNQTQITNTDPLKGPGRDHSSNSASGMIFRQIRRPFCIFDTEAILLLLTASIWNAFVLEIKGRFKKILCHCFYVRSFSLCYGPWWGSQKGLGLLPKSLSWTHQQFTSL